MAKIVFAQNLDFTYQGIMSISAYLKANGHKCDAFVYNEEKDIIKSVLDANPDVVAFSCTTDIFQWALGVAKDLKKQAPKIKTIFGGPHPTFCPEIIEKDAVDIVCRGEGEYPILDLATHLNTEENIKSIQNLWVKLDGKVYKNPMRPLINDLDSLPLPDRDIYYKYPSFSQSSVKYFMAGRGCPFNCSFCFNKHFKELYKDNGTYIRYRSVDNLIEEIKRVRVRWGIKSIRFWDDTFILSKKWLMEFLKKYRQEVGIPFGCGIRADIATEELIREMAISGCNITGFGIESGNEELRNKILKKKLTNEQIIKTSGLLRKYKMPFYANNMMGMPGETIENALETIELNIKIKADYPQCSLFQPYPGTELAGYMAEKEILNDVAPEEIAFSRNRKSLLKQKNINKLINLHHLFYLAVYVPPSLPVIKILLNLPLTRFYHLLFLAGHAIQLKKSLNLSFFELIWLGIKSRKWFS